MFSGPDRRQSEDESGIQLPLNDRFNRIQVFLTHRPVTGLNMWTAWKTIDVNDLHPTLFSFDDRGLENKTKTLPDTMFYFTSPTYCLYLGMIVQLV